MQTNIGISQKVIILDQDNKILTIRRSNTHPYKPLSWDLPGGDLNFGEDPLVGMKREIKEEVGLEISELKPFDVHGNLNADGSYWVTIAYIGKYLVGDIVLSYEHDEFLWVTREEFLQKESSEKLQKFVENLTLN